MKRSNPRHRPGHALVFLAFLLAVTVAPGQSTWNGSVSSVWNVAGNWTGAVPNGGIAAIIPAGTPNSPSTAGVATPACIALTLNAGATLTIASGSILSVSQDAIVNGTISGPGLLKFVGTTVSQISGSGTSCSVEIAKTGSNAVNGLSNFAIAGNLTMTSGGFFPAVAGPAITTVSGQALMQGGQLGSFNGQGQLDVAGNITFSGTSVVNQTPTIHCGGNWSSDAAFAPTSGNVIFSKTGAQTIAVAGPMPHVFITGSSIASVSSLHVLNGLDVNGSLSITPGSLDADDAVTVAAGATLSLGNASNTFGGSLLVNGTMTASGVVTFDGGGTAQLSGSGSFPSIQIAKIGTNAVHAQSNIAIAGNLTITSGGFFPGVGGAFTTTVSGQALMQGGQLGSFNGQGQLDVAGNITFSGTSVINQTPTIHCGANWSSDAAYAPTSGVVIFSKTGAQAITVAGPMPHVFINASSIASVSSLHVLNGLDVNGSLSITPGSLDADDTVTVGAGATLSLGNASNTFGGSLAVNGTMTASGVVTFDGGGTAQLSGSGSFPSIQIAKIGTNAVHALTNIAITGNLTMTSGGFFPAVGGPFTTTVSGQALMQGGEIGSFNGQGQLDVAGNVTFSGTSVINQTATIRCGGNWVADANFNPTSGTVELNGAASTTLAAPAAGGTLKFGTLVIKNGTRSFPGDFTIAAQAITVDPTGTLQIGSGRHERVNQAGSTAFIVNGTLGVASNGELSLGPQTAMSVGSTGTLNVVGTAAQPAKITGEAGGGYGLTVNGTLSAKDFVVKEMGPGGLVIDFGATIAAPPNDFRNGTLDFRTGGSAGSVLLDVRRNAPAILDQLTFLNTPSVAGAFNVKTLSSSIPISLTNWTGAFAGPSFENDPSGLITWNVQAPPVLAAFHVDPGAELCEIVWAMTTQTGAAGFQLRRSTSVAGPFGVVTSPGLAGPAYGIVDQPLPANQAQHYLLYAAMSGGELMLLASGGATPYSSAPPPNVYKVGGGGPFGTIQAAINAATDPSSVVWVTPGTYPSFAIGATAPSNLHVLGFGTGPVSIDTSSGPITISNVPASSGIELSNLSIGSASTAQNAIVISSCACPVVLDELNVSCDGAHVAIQVTASTATAIQRSAIQGGTGLNMSAGSHVAISRGSLSSLVSTGSTIEMTGLAPGSTSVSPPASLTSRSGLMPDLNLPELVKLSHPDALFINAFPSSPYIVIASPRLGFTSIAQFEMPVLVDAVGMTELAPHFTDAQGVGAIGFEVPPSAVLLGFTYVVQAGALDPVSGVWRFSNVETMVGMP